MFVIAKKTTHDRDDFVKDLLNSEFSKKAVISVSRWFKLFF